MPTTINVTTSYAGAAAMDMLTPMFKGLEYYAGILRVEKGVDFKLPIQRTKMTATFKTPSQAFTAGGSVTHDEVILYPQGIEAQWLLSKLNYHQFWNNAGAESYFGSSVPQNVIDAVNKNAVGLNETEFMRLMWVGTTAGSADPLNGLFTQLKSSSDPQKPTWAAITSANVISKLAACVGLKAIAAWKKKGMTKLFVSSDVVSAYEQAVASGNNYRDTTAPIPLNYLGYEMIEVSELPDGTILFANGDNLIIGFNEKDANTYLSVVDKEYTTGDKELAITAGFSIDVKVGWTAETVAYYNPA